LQEAFIKSVPRGGLRQSLDRIASGEFEDSDFQTLERQLTETASEVEKALSRLRKYQDVAREDFGLEFTRVFDDLWYKPEKSWIRFSCDFLVGEWKKDHSDRQFFSFTARKILKEINALDQKLVKLHDIVLDLSDGRAMAAKPQT
jgi:hypothetical protein